MAGPTRPPSGTTTISGASNWKLEISMDFRTIGTDTFVLADNGVEQDVGGYKFEPYGIVGSEELTIDATYGMSGDAPSGTLAWYPSRGTNAVNLTGKQQVAIVCKVWEANTWSGQAGIQIGDGDGTGGGSFNYGADALRTNSTTYQVARRQTGTAPTSGAVSLPSSPGGIQTILLIATRSGVAAYFRTDIGINDSLPSPDDSSWTDAMRRGSTGITVSDDGGQDWEDQDTFHISCWHSGHSPAGQYYSLIECDLYSSDQRT